MTQEENRSQEELEIAVGPAPSAVGGGWLIVVGLFILFIFTAYFINFNGAVSKEHSVWGSTGDYFGGILNPVVSLFTLWLLFRTYQQQQYEFRATRWRMKRQEDELARQVAELEQQTKLQKAELDDQAKANRTTSFENTFFQLLNNHRQLLGSLDMEDGKKEVTGRDVFVFLRKNLTETWKSYVGQTHETLQSKRNELNAPGSMIFNKRQWQTKYDHIEAFLNIPNEQQRIEMVYSRFYNSKQDDLGPYFRSLYNLLRYVHENSPKPKSATFYIKLIRAELSSSQLVILFYNCLTERGSKMRGYIESYGLLKHLDANLLLDYSRIGEQSISHLSLYNVSAYGQEKN